MQRFSLLVGALGFPQKHLIEQFDLSFNQEDKFGDEKLNVEETMQGSERMMTTTKKPYSNDAASGENAVEIVGKALVGKATHKDRAVLLTTGREEQSIPISYRLKGASGDEQVKLTCPDKNVTLSEAWEIFSCPFEEKFTIDFRNDNGTARAVYFQPYPFDRPGYFLTWGEPTNNTWTIANNYNCSGVAEFPGQGFDGEDMRCKQVRSGNFSWGGTYNVKLEECNNDNGIDGCETYQHDNTCNVCVNCKKGFKLSGQTCQNCSNLKPTCKSFYDDTACQCEQCKAGNKLESGSCVECGNSIANCEGYKEDNTCRKCIDCKKGYKTYGRKCRSCSGSVTGCRTYKDNTACRCERCYSGYELRSYKCYEKVCGTANQDCLGAPFNQDILKTTANSSCSCRDKCNRQSGCKYWVWSSNGYTCWLKTNHRYNIYKSGYYCGFRR